MKTKNCKETHFTFHQKKHHIFIPTGKGKLQNREDGIALVALLKACAKQKDLYKGSRIYADVLKSGLLNKNVFIGSSLVNLYAKCGALTQAQEVFDKLRVRNVVAWTALIAGYTQHGHGRKALTCFERMKHEGISPNAVTFACILKACGSIGAAEKGKEIHDEIVGKGLLGKSRVLGTALVDMYAKCGALVRAQQVFDELIDRDVVAWTALIGGYCHYKHEEEALNCLEQMQREGLSPDTVTFAYILQACGSIGAVEKGAEIHAEIDRKGFLGMNNSLGNALVGMYAKCGAFAKAQQVLDKLLVPDVISWTALIAGYAEHGHSEKALSCFQRMQQEGFSPDGVTLACILHVCGSIGAAEKGEEVHAEIVREDLLENDLVLAGALIHMYAKCGALEKAEKMLDELPVREVVTWTALIVGYARHGHGEVALNCFERMQGEKVPPDRVTLLCILQACGSTGRTEKGMEIHAQIIRKGLLGKDSVLGNAVVYMYAKCGAFEEAQQVFDELSVQNLGSWTALIGGYCQHGHGEEALKCFDQMQHVGLSPDALTFTCILKACGSIGAVEKGKEIHDEIIRKELLGKDSVLGTALVDMYAKCGAFAKAEQVFEEIPVHDRVSWTCLISGYSQHGHGEKALERFQWMQEQGLSPDAVTLLSILEACGSIGATEKGIEIHAEIVREGLLGKDGVLGSALVDMYAKCGALTRAQEVFDKLPVRSVVLWTALIAGYTECGHGREAIKCIEWMKRERVSPNVVTFTCILKACGSIGAAEEGRKIHDEILKKGLMGNNSALGNALVDMYGKCGALANAQQVFDELSTRDVVSWTALITGYTRHGQGEKALNCFEQMQHEGLSPNAVTLVCTLKACGNVGAANKGKEIHTEIIRKGWLRKLCVLGNALMYMYASCGKLAKAQQVLNELPNWDEVSWTLLIVGYLQYGYSEEALKCFNQMQCENLSPDEVTCACILQACASIGAAEKGEEIYTEVIKRGFLEKNCVIGNVLVDMYAKCSALAKARKVFDELPIKDVVSWNSLISGYARVGKYGFVIESFNSMIGEGIEPSVVTFMVVLNACSYFGLEDKYQTYFETVSASYGTLSILEHQIWLVNLFSRAGYFDKALSVVGTMPSYDSLPAWFAVLGACQTFGNVKLGRLAYDLVIQLTKNSAVAYAYMSNIYATVGMEEAAGKVEALRSGNEVWEIPQQCQWADDSNFFQLDCSGNKKQRMSAQI